MCDGKYFRSIPSNPPILTLWGVLIAQNGQSFTENTKNRPFPVAFASNVCILRMAWRFLWPSMELGKSREIDLAQSE